MLESSVVFGAGSYAGCDELCISAPRINWGSPDPIQWDWFTVGSFLPEKYWVVLTFFGDESGTHDAKGLLPGSDVCGVFAYGAWKRDWNKFVPMWNGRLRGKGVKLFHMRDFMRKKAYPYRNWTCEERNRFLESLIYVAREKTRIAFGGLLYVPDYDRLVPNDLKSERDHPYYFSFQVFFDTLLRHLETICFPKGQQIAFFFEENPFQGLASRAFWEIKKIRDKNNRLGSIAFLPKKKCVAFQAADMAGWLFREALLRQKNGLARRPWVDQLTEHENIVVGYYDRNNLPLHVAEVRQTRRLLATLRAKGTP